MCLTTRIPYHIVKRCIYKIVFFNPYESAVAVAFKNPHSQTADILSPGISSLCMCDYFWRKTVFSSPIAVWLAEPCITSSTMPSYYLRRVPMKRRGYIAFVVQKHGRPLSLSYMAIMEARLRNYYDCGTKSAMSFQELVPEFVREAMGDHAHKLRTKFHGKGNYVRPCTNILHSVCSFKDPIPDLFPELAE